MTRGLTLALSRVGQSLRSWVACASGVDHLHADAAPCNGRSTRRQEPQPTDSEASCSSASGISAGAHTAGGFACALSGLVVVLAEARRGIRQSPTERPVDAATANLGGGAGRGGWVSAGRGWDQDG
jgi:hypothetical protein